MDHLYKTVFLVVFSLFSTTISTANVNITTTPVVHDLAIIGSGIAGLTAAITAANSRLHNIIVFEGERPGGLLLGVQNVINWPGTLIGHGPTIISTMQEHAEKLGVKFSTDSITSISLDQRPFVMTTEQGDSIQAHTIIIATGSDYKKLGCPGEEFYLGKGIAICTLCDGPLFAGKRVAVIGSNNIAFEKALYMTRFTPDIRIIFASPEPHASPALVTKARQRNIKIIPNTRVLDILGNENHVTHMTLSENGTHYSMEIDGIVIAIGLVPNTAVIPDAVHRTETGHISCNRLAETNIPGIFVAGTVCNGEYIQALPAAAGGFTAAAQAEKYLAKLRKIK